MVANRMSLYNIAVVERETGLSKETLRIWEHRYEFPKPERSDNGERLYNSNHIEDLKMIQALIRQGHKPGQVVGLPRVELKKRLANESRLAEPSDLTRPLVEIIRSHDQREIMNYLQQVIQTKGWQNFIVQLSPLYIHEIGELWSVGALTVYEEHLFSNALLAVFRRLSDEVSEKAPVPKMREVYLLTTPPGERHALGIQMVKILLLAKGHEVIDLGTETPLAEILEFARVKKLNVIGIGVSPSVNVPTTRDFLKNLLDGLPGDIKVWVGGEHRKALRMTHENLQFFESLDSLL